MSSHNPLASQQAATGLRPPIQSPGSAGFRGSIWRSADCLVVAHKAHLPERCVKCNTPVVYKRDIKLAWHNPVVYAGLFLGLIPYVLLAIALQKRMTVRVGLCPAHVAKRRYAMLFGVLGCFAGLGVIILGIGNDSGWIALGGLVALLGALIYLAFAPRIVWPKKITRELAWVKGVSPEYLAGLPELPLL
jgi:hypothetical protein